jgi:hypothetical protein
MKAPAVVKAFVRGRLVGRRLATAGMILQGNDG